MKSDDKGKWPAVIEFQYVQEPGIEALMKTWWSGIGYEKMIPPIIDEFLKDRHFTHESSWRQCFTTSIDFLMLLMKRNVIGNLVCLEGYVGGPFPHYDIEPGSICTHYVVNVGNLTYDFTYKQFDKWAPVPRVKTIEELSKDWEVVTIETPDGFKSKYL